MGSDVGNGTINKEFCMVKDKPAEDATVNDSRSQRQF